MAKYTTGEIAKLCDVSVRTVQYYDSRKILVPTEISEGGRRLYSDNDLSKMKIICYFKKLGLSLDNIAKIMLESNSNEVLSLILEEQKKNLEDEIKNKQDSLNKLNKLQMLLQNTNEFNINDINDIDYESKKKKLDKLHYSLIIFGLPMNVFQWVSIILWITNGIWWLFIIYLFCALLFGLIILKYYFKMVLYICPNCHKTFKPNMKEAFWAKHTPKTRKLTCPDCDYHGYCVEIYNDKQ